MVILCKGKCVYLRFLPPLNIGSVYQWKLIRYCRPCESYYHMRGYKCPCCHGLLRTRAKGGHSRLNR